MGGGEPDKFLVWMAAVSPSIIRLSSLYRGITLKILVSTLPLEKEESGEEDAFLTSSGVICEGAFLLSRGRKPLRIYITGVPL